jgi:hypothetical protein
MVLLHHEQQRARAIGGERGARLRRRREGPFRFVFPEATLRHAEF